MPGFLSGRQSVLGTESLGGMSVPRAYSQGPEGYARRLTWFLGRTGSCSQPWAGAYLLKDLADGFALIHLLP